MTITLKDPSIIQDDMPSLMKFPSFAAGQGQCLEPNKLGLNEIRSAYYHNAFDHRFTGVQDVVA